MKNLLLENSLNSEYWLYFGIYSLDNNIKHRSFLKALEIDPTVIYIIITFSIECINQKEFDLLLSKRKAILFIIQTHKRIKNYRA